MYFNCMQCRNVDIVLYNVYLFNSPATVNTKWSTSDLFSIIATKKGHHTTNLESESEKL